MRRQQAPKASSDPFEMVRKAARPLADVEPATKYDGSPVLRAGGSFMAGLGTHCSVEPDTLVVRATLEQREWLLEDAPDIYYVTDYYRKRRVVLVRLSRIDPDALRDLLAASWRLTMMKVRGRGARRLQEAQLRSATRSRASRYD